MYWCDLLHRFCKEPITKLLCLTGTLSGKNWKRQIHWAKLTISPTKYHPNRNLDIVKNNSEAVLCVTWVMIQPAKVLAVMCVGWSAQPVCTSNSSSSCLGQMSQQKHEGEHYQHTTTQVTVADQIKGVPLVWNSGLSVPSPLLATWAKIDQNKLSTSKMRFDRAGLACVHQCGGNRGEMTGGLGCTVLFSPWWLRTMVSVFRSHGRCWIINSSHSYCLILLMKTLSRVSLFHTEFTARVQKYNNTSWRNILWFCGKHKRASDGVTVIRVNTAPYAIFQLIASTQVIALSHDNLFK